MSRKPIRIVLAVVSLVGAGLTATPVRADVSGCASGVAALFSPVLPNGGVDGTKAPCTVGSTGLARGEDYLTVPPGARFVAGSMSPAGPLGTLWVLHVHGLGANSDVCCYKTDEPRTGSSGTHVGGNGVAIDPTSTGTLTVSYSRTNGTDVRSITLVRQ